MCATIERLRTVHALFGRLVEVHLQQVVMLFADREAAAAFRRIDLERVARIRHHESYIFVVELQLRQVLDYCFLNVDRRLVLANSTHCKCRVF
jgi:hypothetical protein